MTNRKPPRERKEQILDAAILLARKQGYTHLTRLDIANVTGLSEGLVSKYFGTMPQMRRAILSAAIVRQDLVVIAQGLVAREAKVLKLPEATRRLAMEACL